MHETAPWFLYNPFILATYSLREYNSFFVTEYEYIYPVGEVKLSPYPGHNKRTTARWNELEFLTVFRWGRAKLASP